MGSGNFEYGVKLVWSGFSSHRLSRVMLLFVAFCSNQLVAQQATNFEMLTSLVDSTLQGALGNVAVQDECVHTLALDAAGDSNWFIDARLSEIFSRAGIFVRIPERVSEHREIVKSDSCRILLEYKVLSLGIQYSGQRTAAILTRTAGIRIYLRTISVVNGEVGISKTIEASKSDQVAQDSILELEDKSIPFTKGETRLHEGGIKIIRPLVVSVASGIIVYLFYSLRSR